jgi:hypothetical protein
MKRLPEHLLLSFSFLPALGASAQKGSEILWDRYGVAHVYAKTNEDLFYCYGWAQAQRMETCRSTFTASHAAEASSIRPSVDAISKLKVLTGLYSAEYGRSAGGQIAAITKWGSNEFRGTAFEFIRNQVVDARNVFTHAGQDPVFSATSSAPRSADR